MKNNHLLLLGALLILIGVISLSNIFWEDEILTKPNLVENKKQIEDPQLDSSIKNKKQITLTSPPIKTKKENVDYIHIENDVVDPLEAQKIQEREYKRMLAIEERKSRMAERKRYKTARIEWRKALNKARKEAKLTGDYSKFEALKKQEPGKE